VEVCSAKWYEEIFNGTVIYLEYIRIDVFEDEFKGLDASNKMCAATDNNAAFKIIWNFVCFLEIW